MSSTTLLKVVSFLLFLAITSAGQFGRTLRQEEACPASEGYYRDEMDCGKFYRCVVLPPGSHSESSSSTGRYEFHCPAGTVFDQRFSTCNYPHQVDQKDSCAGPSSIAYPPPSPAAPGAPVGSYPVAGYPTPPPVGAYPTPPPASYPPSQQGIVVPAIPDGSYPASGKVVIRNPQGGYGYHKLPVVANRYPANYY